MPYLNPPHNTPSPQHAVVRYSVCKALTGLGIAVNEHCPNAKDALQKVAEHDGHTGEF